MRDTVVCGHRFGAASAVTAFSRARQTSVCVSRQDAAEDGRGGSVKNGFDALRSEDPWMALTGVAGRKPIGRQALRRFVPTKAPFKTWGLQ